MHWLKSFKKNNATPHGARERLDFEFPFAQLSGSVRDLTGARHSSVLAARASWPPTVAPQLFVVTQKRIFADPFVRTWRDGVATMDESRRPLFCELVLVDEFLWTAIKRLTERSVAGWVPEDDRARVLNHYGTISNDVISACGGLRYHVLPTALLIDAKGRLRWRTQGVCEPADLEDLSNVVQSLK